MIFIVVILVAFIGLAEFLIAAQRSKNKSEKLKINNLNNQFTILKPLSYLYLSKHLSEKNMLNEFVTSFFMQSKLDTFIFIPIRDSDVSGAETAENVFRFSNKAETFFYADNANLKDSKTMVNYLQSAAEVLPAQNFLTGLERYLLKDAGLENIKPGNQILPVRFLQNIARDKNIKLNPKESNWRTAAIMEMSYKSRKVGYAYFFSGDDLGDEDLNFINIAGNILTLNLIKFQVDRKLDVNTQLKVVSQAW